MKSPLSRLLLVCALATPALAGPDFSSHSPHARPLAASTGTSEIGPFEDVVFAHDSTQLTDSDYALIASAAQWLKKHDQRVVLEGYADATGEAIYNEDLATRRAFIVRQQLLANGIAPDRIIMVVYGEQAAIGAENPLDRRVVMYATKLPPQQVAAASLDHKRAISTTWFRENALFTESRGAQKTAVGVATREKAKRR